MFGIAAFLCRVPGGGPYVGCIVACAPTPGGARRAVSCAGSQPLLLGDLIPRMRSHSEPVYVLTSRILVTEPCALMSSMRSSRCAGSHPQAQPRGRLRRLAAHPHGYLGAPVLFLPRVFYHSWPHPVEKWTAATKRLRACPLRAQARGRTTQRNPAVRSLSAARAISAATLVSGGARGRARLSARRRRPDRDARSAAACAACGTGSWPSAAAVAHCPRRGASARSNGRTANRSR